MMLDPAVRALPMLIALAGHSSPVRRDQGSTCQGERTMKGIRLVPFVILLVLFVDAVQSDDFSALVLRMPRPS